MGINFPLWSPTIGDVPPSVINELLGGTASLKNTVISTAGAGTLTAAAIAGGQITRTGPTGAYTVTTDTAAAILTALGGTFESGATFQVSIKNQTVWPQTLAAGTGVTMSTVTVNPPYSIATYFGTFGGTNSAPTVTLTHRYTSAGYETGANSTPISTAISTVGAGTLTAAAIVGGVITRTGSTTAFTDTTDTAAAVIGAAFASTSAIGASFLMTYVNNTVAAATISGGASLTVSGITIVPANSWAKYLVTYNGAGTVTMVGIEQGYFPVSGTVTANAATPVVVAQPAVTAGSNIILTYASGSVGATGAFVSAKTAGTSFSIKSVTSDTAVYNYTILG